ncbi:hypothetical protein [Nocardia sp. NBC_01327]|uniref:hypothetical protein n=1 Tax=Nocardia sp. NBC_01327 TaxID=2903593 RepID=UPI002E114B5E|nr:hypothetical protein OG326_36480 [Nocardia sp. NBC_01327]
MNSIYFPYGSPAEIDRRIELRTRRRAILDRKRNLAAADIVLHEFERHGDVDRYRAAHETLTEGALADQPSRTLLRETARGFDNEN